MQPRVGVTEPEYWKAPEIFEACPLGCIPVPEQEEALAQAILDRQLRHVIVGPRPYCGPLYAALPPGGVIARFGVGHDNLNKRRATEAGLLCTNTPEVLNQSVVEHTLALLFAAARRLHLLHGTTKAGLWQPLTGTELAGKTLAIVGCGSIGRRVALAASRGLGMCVVGVTRHVSQLQPVSQEYGIQQLYDALEPALAVADFVSLHVPGGSATYHLINADRLRQFRPQAWLINTSRGSVVDEIALYDALVEGRLGGAALDVFEREPYEPSDPRRDLRTLPNVILTPHCGSNTAEANRRMAERALRNIELAEAGRYAEMDLLNREVLARLGQPGGRSPSA